MLRGTEIRTQRAEVREVGEGDDPDVHGVDNIVMIELEEPVLVLDTWMSERSIKQRTNQKAIS